MTTDVNVVNKSNYWRQLRYVDPEEVYIRIEVIGAGATGSHVVLGLTKMGVGISCPITVWDGDIVEDHNLPNQVYGQKHIGESKVEALQKHVEEVAGISINIRDEYFNPDNQQHDLGGIVFLLVDTIKARKEIYEKAIKNKAAVKWLIDARIGINYGQIYVVNTKDEGCREQYESSLLQGDDEIPDPPCNNKIAIPIVMFSVGLALESFIGITRGKELPHFIDFNSACPAIHCEQ